MRATEVALVLVVGTASISLVKRSVIMSTNWLPCLVFDMDSVGPYQYFPMDHCGRTVLASVTALRAYSSARKNGNNIQQSKRQLPYEASKTSLS